MIHTTLIQKVHHPDLIQEVFAQVLAPDLMAIDSCTLIASDKAAAISANVRDSSGFSNETEGTEGIEDVVEADDAF